MSQYTNNRLLEYQERFTQFGCCVCDVATGDEILIEDIDDPRVVELIALHQEFDEDTHICEACLESKRESVIKTERVKEIVKERLGG